MGKAVATAGCRKAFFARYSEANEENVSEFLAFSPDNPSSIRNCIEIARTNARAVRTALTTEMWETINGAWLELKRFGNGPTSREEFLRFLRWVQETSLRFDGSAYRTMLRNDAYWFSRLGLYIERADNTARILDVKYHMLLPADEHVGGPLDYYPMVGDPAHGLGPHRLSLGLPREPQAVAGRRPPDPQRADAALAGELLREPGALSATHIATAYGRQGPAQRQARTIRTRLENSRIEEIFQTACTNSSSEFVADNNGWEPPSRSQYLIANRLIAVDRCSRRCSFARYFGRMAHAHLRLRTKPLPLRDRRPAA